MHKSFLNRCPILILAVFVGLNSHAADVVWTNLNGGLWNAAHELESESGARRQ
jgi:hypothetical protein